MQRQKGNSVIQFGFPQDHEEGPRLRAYHITFATQDTCYNQQHHLSIGPSTLCTQININSDIVVIRVVDGQLIRRITGDSCVGALKRVFYNEYDCVAVNSLIFYTQVYNGRNRQAKA